MLREIKFKFWNKKKKIMLYFDVCNSESMGYKGMFIPVDKNLFVLQYTGLTDISGKEIYEGDIVKQGNHKDAEVFFRNGSFCTYVDDGMWLEMSNNSFEFEVIGNIYENKDLLCLLS